MTIGAGLAMVAIWGCVAVSMVAPRVSGVGMVYVLLCATLATIVIVTAGR